MPRLIYNFLKLWPYFVKYFQLLPYSIITVPDQVVLILHNTNHVYQVESNQIKQFTSVVSSVPCICKVACSNIILATTCGPWASPSLVVICITWCGARRGCLTIKFHSCNNLLSSVHTCTLLVIVNILPWVILYIKRKYYDACCNPLYCRSPVAKVKT